MITPQQNEAQAWFHTLRDQICREFEHLEQAAPNALYQRPPARFEYTDWKGQMAGGGTGGLLRGRLFEKCGVHISTVQGRFSPEMQKTIKGAQDNPNFWAAGISLIAHMRNPHIPAMHMNTRYIVTTQDWFGGGADLTPTQSADRHMQNPDARLFHAAMRQSCDKHASVANYDNLKRQCDEYFYLPHRREARGIGGIFFDHHNSGNWNADFAFCQDVGQQFLKAASTIIRQRMHTRWTEQDREEQLIQRGRYVEFNLLYDRGTMFGLKTGGNIETILSSMPPVVKWP